MDSKYKYLVSHCDFNVNNSRSSFTDPCPEGYIPFDDQCIQFSDTKAKYHEAQVACHEEDGELLVPLFFHEVSRLSRRCPTWPLGMQKC